MSTPVFPSNPTQAKLAISAGLTNALHAENCRTAQYPVALDITSIGQGFLFRTRLTTNLTTPFGASFVWSYLMKGVVDGEAIAANEEGFLPIALILAPLRNEAPLKVVVNARNSVGLAAIQKGIEDSFKQMRDDLNSNMTLTDAPAYTPAEYVGEPQPAPGVSVFPSNMAEASLLDVANIENLHRQNVGTAKQLTTTHITSLKKGTLFRVWVTTDTTNAFGQQFFLTTFGNVVQGVENICKTRKVSGFLPLHVGGMPHGIPNFFDIRKAEMLNVLEDQMADRMQWFREALATVVNAYPTA